MQLPVLLTYWSDFAHFFPTTKLIILHGLKLFAKNLMQKAMRRRVFNSIHINFFLSNFICLNDLKFSVLLCSLIICLLFMFVNFLNDIFVINVLFVRYLCPNMINLNQHMSFEKDNQRSSKVIIA